LPIGWIERITTVAPLADVICKHAMLGLCLRTPPAVLDCLTARARTIHDNIAPLPVFRRYVERIDRLSFWLDPPMLEGS
jgi:hypothetical protein